MMPPKCIKIGLPEFDENADKIDKNVK